MKQKSSFLAYFIVLLLFIPILLLPSSINQKEGMVYLEGTDWTPCENPQDYYLVQEGDMLVYNLTHGEEIWVGGDIINGGDELFTSWTIKIIEINCSQVEVHGSLINGSVVWVELCLYNASYFNASEQAWLVVTNNESFEVMGNEYNTFSNLDVLGVIAPAIAPINFTQTRESWKTFCLTIAGYDYFSWGEQDAHYYLKGWRGSEDGSGITDSDEGIELVFERKKHTLTKLTLYIWNTSTERWDIQLQYEIFRKPSAWEGLLPIIISLVIWITALSIGSAALVVTSFLVIKKPKTIKIKIKP